MGFVLPKCRQESSELADLSADYISGENESLNQATCLDLDTHVGRLGSIP